MRRLCQHQAMRNHIKVVRPWHVVLLNWAANSFGIAITAVGYLYILPVPPIAQNADDLAALVRGSYGWRASHIDRHIREWYRLADDAPVQPWMREEFLDMVVQSGIKQGKVFQWSLRGESGAQPTYSVLRYTNGRWLVSQYYANGARAGEFATAFEPTARQLARMLQQASIR